MKRRHFGMLAALLLFSGGCETANAQLTIDAVFTGTDTADFPGSAPISSSTSAATIETTIESAISQITENVTCNSPIALTIEFVSDPNIDLGASSYGVSDIPYADYLSYLEGNTGKSPNDLTALASLPAGPGTGINNNASEIELGGPLLDAIGDTTLGNEIISGNQGVAGTVALNMTEMNISRTGYNNSEFDLVSTVIHEVDEVLGIGGAGSTLAQGQTPGVSGTIGPMDLFRFSAPGSRSYTTSTNARAYFSINDGAKELVYFNQFTGGDFGDWGDGATPADGEPNSPPQVQDAYGDTEDKPNIGPNELTALDVVGWNLTAAGMSLDGIPEPGSYASVLLGGLMLAGFQGCRRGYWSGWRDSNSRPSA